jgi:DNA polymerase-1
MLAALPYRYIVAVDFEFEFGGHSTFEEASRSGERPRPVCMVAKELRSGQTWRLWRGQFGSTPPFPTGPDALVVAYYASAELGCFHALGWKPPTNILDLYSEFRNRTNGLETVAGSGLVGALVYFGLDTIGAQEKDQLRLRILGGGPWSESEYAEFLDYCETDVLALERLLPAMLPPRSNSGIDLPRALLRGRYMAAAAAMEWHGVPINSAELELLRERWNDIRGELIRKLDSRYGVFDGDHFRAERWAQFLARHNIPWPVLESGHLDLSEDVFREMAKIYPIVSPMRELRHALSGMRLNDLAVGRDGRNRTILSAFGSKTGRNTPSNTRFIFGPSVWLRYLIAPPPGYGIAYIDWKTQEFGIAAALSNDAAMMAAYATGDPYLAFGKQVGLIPPYGTDKTHKAKRQLCKQCILGIAYGMEEQTLARRIGHPPIVARDLLRAHRETYRTFWRWSDAAVDHAMLHGSLHTVFGWHVHVGENPNPRSLRNFPMQANGAEMMRLAACLATERGIEVCAPVHDAFLICAPLDRLDEDVARIRACMEEASRIVLDGFEVRTTVEEKAIVRHPGHYTDDRGEEMWNTIMPLLARYRKVKRAVS